MTKKLLAFCAAQLMLSCSGMATTIYPAAPVLTPGVLPDADGIAKEAEPATPLILQIDFIGPITGASYEKLMQELAQARNGALRDYKLAGILLYISSTMGDIGYAALISDTVKQFAQQLSIPIYSFADSECGWEGYEVACAAEKIYLADSTSIGLFGSNRRFFNFRQNVQIVDGSLGVSVTTSNPDIKLIYKGIDKVVGDPFLMVIA